MPKNLNARAFSAVKALIIIVIVAALGLGGYFVWQKNKDEKPGANTNTSQNNQKPSDKEQKPVDPYEGWQSYNNDTYGISFKYPAGWRVEEVSVSTERSSVYPISTEFAVNVKRSEDVKYNNTIAVEVLHQNLDVAEAEYDELYAQAPSNPASKTNGELKGKRFVQYVKSNEKLCLFAVGNKTYSYRSINEGLNAQLDPDYWTKFNKVLDSFGMK